MTSIVFENRAPSVSEFNRLKESVGWSITDEVTTLIGLQNSLYIVTALLQKTVIGTGRVVGDGGLYYHLQDVIVHPEMQGKGIGTGIVKMLMDYVRNNASKNVMVGLLCAKGYESLYEMFGFISRPNENYGPGMVLFI